MRNSTHSWVRDIISGHSCSCAWHASCTMVCGTWRICVYARCETIFWEPLCMKNRPTFYGNLHVIVYANTHQIACTKCPSHPLLAQGYSVQRRWRAHLWMPALPGVLRGQSATASLVALVYSAVWRAHPRIPGRLVVFCGQSATASLGGLVYSAVRSRQQCWLPMRCWSSNKCNSSSGGMVQKEKGWCACLRPRLSSWRPSLSICPRMLSLFLSTPLRQIFETSRNSSFCIFLKSGSVYQSKSQGFTPKERKKERRGKK